MLLILERIILPLMFCIVFFLFVAVTFYRVGKKKNWSNQKTTDRIVIFCIFFNSSLVITNFILKINISFISFVGTVNAYFLPLEFLLMPFFIRKNLEGEGLKKYIFKMLMYGILEVVIFWVITFGIAFFILSNMRW